MCNTLVQRPRRSDLEALELQAKLDALMRERTKPLARRTDPVAVLRTGEAGPEPAVMRWGFFRPFNPAVNNARTDKLSGSMWTPAWRERRCLLPASLFYEWGEAGGDRASAGKKQAYRFTRPDGDWMWMAALWESHPEQGDCCTVLTTSAPPLMAPIHHRMPAILDWPEALAFLGDEPVVPAPYGGTLEVEACESPLRRSRSGDSGSPGLEQGELFL